MQRARFSCPHEPILERQRRDEDSDDPDRDREAEAERERSSVPAGDDQAPDALDQVRDRVHTRDEAEPVDIDQVPRRVHRGQEEEDEEEREQALDRLARPRAQRQEEAEGAEADRDDGREQEQHEDPQEAGREVDADDEADKDVEAGLDEAEDDRAGEQPRDQGDAAHRRQREPVQEARLDVPSKIRAGVHGREERALDERDGEREGDERVGREAGEAGRRLEPAGVHEQEQHREDEREDDGRRLAARPDDRASRDRADLREKAGSGAGHAAGSAASGSWSPAPSSERPVLARKTSSSDGAWISRWARVSPAASTARTTAGRPARPSRRRTTTSPVPPSRDSPCGASAETSWARSSWSTGVAWTLGSPISAFKAFGVPSATMCPWSMIPTRSARTSASSRYCVVRNTVTPSSRASLATSSQRAVRLWMSSPVVGSSRKRIRGRCTSARARSSRRFIPPE